MLCVVVGPPAGGKSTWVLNRAKPGDVVIDFDRLAVALGGPGAPHHDHSAAVSQVTAAAWNAAVKTAVQLSNHIDVYLIHSVPTNALLGTYRRANANIVVIDPGIDVVKERCVAQRPPSHQRFINQWYARS